MAGSIDAGVAEVGLRVIPSGPATSREADRRLYRIMLWAYATLFPLTALDVVVGVLSGSSTILVYVIDSGICIVIQGFSIYAMRQVMRADTFRLPYGAGKLENFAAFLAGVLMVPSGACVIYLAVTRLLHPEAVGYGLAAVLLVIETARIAVLYASVRKLAHREETPAPLLQAYLLEWRVNLLSDVGVFVALAAGGLLAAAGLTGVGDRVDPAIALAISAYMLWAGVVLVRRNFRALMDLPLPEEEQLKVMKVLAEQYSTYETVGTIYTRSSGKSRFVEIELGFPETRSLMEITELGREMEEALAASVPDLVFRVIPVVRQ
jgi:cation diffusion facilitator family transporter